MISCSTAQPNSLIALLGSAGRLLTPPTRAGESLCLIGGTKQRHRLVDAFLLLELGFRIGDDTGARLYIHHAVFEQRRAQGDAGIHLFAGRKISDAASVEGTF